MPAYLPLKYPQDKQAVVVFSIDDCHPAISEDGYDAGGGLEKGVLGLLKQLLDQHRQLKCTLFTTADWRERRASLTRKRLAQIPWLRNYIYLAPRWPKGKMRLDRHPNFISYLRQLPRTEIAAHGLEHVGKGLEVIKEFALLDSQECIRRLRQIKKIFEDAGLGQPQGFAPPGWALTEPLLTALASENYQFICSARDLKTDFSLDALSCGAGSHGLSLFAPAYLDQTPIVHMAANWSVNSSFERAQQIIEGGGMLSIKAHMIKDFFGHKSLDGLDKSYSQYLSRLFTHLENRYGESIWWATMSEVAEWYRTVHVPQQSLRLKTSCARP